MGISRVISTLNGVTLITTLLFTDLLSPPGLQVLEFQTTRHSNVVLHSRIFEPKNLANVA